MGQALVEFALILPLQLLVILGGLHLGLLVVQQTRLTHAAQEAAIAGAVPPGDCVTAESAAPRIYGDELRQVECQTDGSLVEVRLGQPVVGLLPFLPDFITVTGRAVVR